MQHNNKIIRIVYLAFPDKIHGATVETDDEFLIGINSGITSITKRFALGHELAHVYLNHLSSGKPLQDAEREANRNAWRFYRAFRDSRLPG